MINIRAINKNRLWLKRSAKFGTLLFLIVFFFSACKSAKVVSDKSVTDNSKIESEKTTTEEVNQSEKRESNLFQTTDVEISGIIYDTEKPPDPDTGKPPILFEGTISKKNNSTLVNTENVETEKNVKIEENQNVQNDIKVDEEIKEELNKQIPAFYQWSAAILITLILIAIIYIAKKSSWF